MADKVRNAWLQELIGETYTAELDKAVSDYVGKNFVAKADFNAKLATITNLQNEITSRDNLIAQKGTSEDPEVVRIMQELREENAALAAQGEELKRAQAVEESLRAAGAVNAKAVSALLDHERISYKDNKLTGLKEQLADLQKQEPWAFAAKQPTRTVHQAGGRTPNAVPVGDIQPESQLSAVDATMNSIFRGAYQNITQGEEE